MGRDTRTIHSLLITNPLAAPPLPRMVSLPAGKVVHCCRQITSDCWLLLPLIESEFSFLHQSICMRPDLSCLQFDQTHHKALWCSLCKLISETMEREYIFVSRLSVHLSLSVSLTPSCSLSLHSSVKWSLVGKRAKSVHPSARTPEKVATLFIAAAWLC